MRLAKLLSNDRQHAMGRTLVERDCFGEHKRRDLAEAEAGGADAFVDIVRPEALQQMQCSQRCNEQCGLTVGRLGELFDGSLVAQFGQIVSAQRKRRLW